MHEIETLAIGGGLAGAAFALELARNGRAVTVLESTKGAHHKVCGEFISTEAHTLLAYLGLDTQALGASTVTTLRVAAGNGRATAPLPFTAHGLSRHCLDETLLTAAASAGADIRRGTRVNRLDAASDGVVVEAGDTTFSARRAALATGKHGLRDHPRRPSDMVGFKLQLDVAPEAAALLDGHVQLVTFEDGYIGACFVEDDRVTLCWVMRERLVKRIGGGWAEQSVHLAQQSDVLATVLEGATPLWDKPVAVAGIPYGYLRREPISPAVYPLGDQLAVIPSYTGDGNAIALFTGMAAAQAMLDGRDATPSQADMLRRLTPQFRIARAANLMFETRLGQRLGIAATSRLPAIATAIARATRLRGYGDVLKPVAGYVILNESDDPNIPGDVDIFKTVEEAERELEPWYVDVPCTVLGCNGRPMRLSLVDGRVRILPIASGSEDPELAKRYLRDLIRSITKAKGWSHVTMSEGELETATLAELVRVAMLAKTL